MSQGEPISIFEALGAADAKITETTDGRPHPLRDKKGPTPRELFLTGLLATWAAGERGVDATPNREEKRRARAGARAALGEIER